MLNIDIVCVLCFTVVQADLHYQRRGEENRVGLRVKVWWPLDQK